LTLEVVMKPTRKVGASALAGALSVILVYVIDQASSGDPLPATVASAITVVLSFVVGYFVPESEG